MRQTCGRGHGNMRHALPGQHIEDNHYNRQQNRRAIQQWSGSNHKIRPLLPQGILGEGRNDSPADHGDHEQHDTHGQ
jgi:hypothetical protein